MNTNTVTPGEALIQKLIEMSYVGIAIELKELGRERLIEVTQAAIDADQGRVKLMEALTHLLANPSGKEEWQEGAEALVSIGEKK